MQRREWKVCRQLVKGSRALAIGSPRTWCRLGTREAEVIEDLEKALRSPGFPCATACDETRGPAIKLYARA